MSNNGQVHVGIIACRELMPKVWDLVRHFPAELDALTGAAKKAGAIQTA
jgi:diacylglycerol O-acyltransferase